MNVLTHPEHLATALAPGALLLRNDAPTPSGLQLEKQPLAREWTLLAHQRPAELDRQITRAGWHLFFIPPEFHTSAFAFDPHTALERALAKMLAHADARKTNALEITGLSVKNCLGLYRASLRGVLRHLQESFILFQEPQRPLPRATRAAA